MAFTTQRPAMASAAVISPVKGYSRHPPANHPPPPLSYPLHQTALPSPYSISGLISPPDSHGAESRRTSDDPNEYPQHQRQSLPSISEALYLRPGPQGAPQAPPPALPQSFANPFSQAPPTPTSRSYSIDGPPPYAPPTGHSQFPQRSPPPPVHPSASFSGSSSHYNAPNHEAPRHQSLPSLRTALPPQTSPYAAHHGEPTHYEPDPRSIDRGPEIHAPLRHNDQYYGYATASTNGSPTGYPPRPKSLFWTAQGGYNREENRSLNGDPESEEDPTMVFQKTLQQNLGNHDFEIALRELRQCGAEVCKISDDILDTVRQHQHEPDVPGIPAMRYHDAMLGCQRKLDEAFHNVKHFMAQQQRQLDDHRLLVQNGKGAEYGDDEQWGTDKEQSFHGPDTKRSRRGRAAPPGRCHSCNRAETPEWRRGPDGARTLCNACGLHYAKLTRRMGAKQVHGMGGSSLRPKSMDSTPPL